MAGVIRTPAFVNTTAGSKYVSSSGAWLAAPDAALIGDANNSDSTTAVLLALSNPAYDATTQVRHFSSFRDMTLALHAHPGCPQHAAQPLPCVRLHAVESMQRQGFHIAAAQQSMWPAACRA